MARENWRNEIHKFSLTPRDVYIVFDHRDLRGLGDKIAGGGAYVVVASYEGLEGILNRNPELSLDLLIVDEGHYAKEPTTKRTQRVFGKAGAVHKAKRTWVLTATPTPNHAGELWPLLFTFGQTRLQYLDFTERYCRVRKTGFGRQICGSNTQPERILELKKALSPIMYRQTKEEVGLELPPITYEDVVVKPGPVKLIYCASLRKFVVPVDRTEDLVKAIEAQLGVVEKAIHTYKHLPDGIMKGLASIAPSIGLLRQYNGAQKVDPVIELVSQELDNLQYPKIVLFAYHVDVVEGLLAGLKKYGAATIYGGTRPDRFEKRVSDFQTRRRNQVLICNIQSAGTSLNLTAANQVMFVEQDWVPGNNAQAAMRCHRIGQKSPVTVRFVGLAGSFDQYLAQMLRRKTEEINKIYSSIKDDKLKMLIE